MKRGNLNSLNHKMSKKVNEMFLNHKADLVIKWYIALLELSLNGI